MKIQRYFPFENSKQIIFSHLHNQIYNLLKEAERKRDMLITQAQLQTKRPIIPSLIPLVEEQLERKRFDS